MNRAEKMKAKRIAKIVALRKKGLPWRKVETALGWYKGNGTKVLRFARRAGIAKIGAAA